MTAHLVGEDRTRTLCGIYVSVLPEGDTWAFQSSATYSSCAACINANNAPVTVRREGFTVHREGNPRVSNEEHGSWATLLGSAFDYHQECTKELQIKVAQLEEDVSVLTLVLATFLPHLNSECRETVMSLLKSRPLPSCRPELETSDDGGVWFKPEILRTTQDPPTVLTIWERLLEDASPPQPVPTVRLTHGSDTAETGKEGD
jgi:hypothetical protein